jgi:hypothetical protein
LRSFFFGFFKGSGFVSAVIAAEEDLDFALGFAESLLALTRESNALLKQFERSIERKIARLELADDLLQVFE